MLELDVHRQGSHAHNKFIHLEFHDVTGAEYSHRVWNLWKEFSPWACAAPCCKVQLDEPSNLLVSILCKISHNLWNKISRDTKFHPVFNLNNRAHVDMLRVLKLQNQQAMLKTFVKCMFDVVMIPLINSSEWYRAWCCDVGKYASFCLLKFDKIHFCVNIDLECFIKNASFT